MPKLTTEQCEIAQGFKKGDEVEILPEFQDAGDGDFRWVVLEDEEKGRVDICPVDVPMAIKPRYTVLASQIRAAGAGIERPRSRE